jgi:hypothetical protein
MGSQHRMDQSALYQIRVQGSLDEEWSGYFEGLEICRVVTTDGKPVTLLTGQLVDQAALQGTLQKLYALGLVLISVQTLDSNGVNKTGSSG